MKEVKSLLTKKLYIDEELLPDSMVEVIFLGFGREVMKAENRSFII